MKRQHPWPHAMGNNNSDFKNSVSDMRLMSERIG